MNMQDLIGKTITEATHLKASKYDDEPFLRLKFSDGTVCYLEGGYGAYTGESADEYRCYIMILTESEVQTDCELFDLVLVPVEEST